MPDEPISTPRPPDQTDPPPKPPPRRNRPSQPQPSLSSSSASSIEADGHSVDTALTESTTPCQSVSEVPSQSSSSIASSTPKASHETDRTARESLASQRTTDRSLFTRLSTYLAPAPGSTALTQKDWKQPITRPSEILDKRRGRQSAVHSYATLAERPCRFEEVILRQLDQLAFFIHQDKKVQDDLIEVIKVYVNFDYQVYDEHFPFLVYTLLKTHSKKETFDALMKLLNERGLRNYYTSQKKEKLHERLDQLDAWMRSELPEVCEHLDMQDIHPSEVVKHWFANFFASSRAEDVECHVLERLLKEGDLFLLKLAFTLFERNKTTLVSLNGCSLMTFLENSIFDIFQGDIGSVLQGASKRSISEKSLTKLIKARTNKRKQAEESKELSEHLKKQNAELEEQLKALEKSFQKLEKERERVTGQAVDTQVAMTQLKEESGVLKHELTKITRERDQHVQRALKEVNDTNATLRKNNASLEDQLTRLEQDLITVKVQYAEKAAECDEIRHLLPKKD